MDFIDLLRLSYLGAAMGVLFIASIPALRDRFLAYGARASPSTTQDTQGKVGTQIKGDKTHTSSSNLLMRPLDFVAGLKVPHHYFITFYLLSTSLSAFWLFEVLYHGRNFKAIASQTQPGRASMSLEKVQVTWAMMFIQGSRRLYECLVSISEAKSNTASKMQVSHWVLGLSFYLATSIAIWIEGIPTLQNHTFSLQDLNFRAPTLRTIFATLLFILASGIQHDCHIYLSQLKSSKSKSADANDHGQKEGEYKIPTHPSFQSLIAPHYTAECLIYFSLAIIAAPQGAWLNLTLTSALIFVLINLGVTAGGTRQWYERRFGTEAVDGKWNMIPLLY